jgi:uncharacterized membrane protein
MPGSDTVIAGIDIPSTDPVFLVIVAVHIFAGLTCVICGAIAMLSHKGPGRHPVFGSIYFWGLAVVAGSAIVLSALRWAEDYYFAVLGLTAFSAAFYGRTARRRRWQNWPRLHMSGMGVSYIVMLTAFYVDNAKNLPLWKDLPSIAVWLIPSAIGLPILAYELVRHPLARGNRA